MSRDENLHDSEENQNFNNFDWYFNRNRVLEPSNIDRTLAAEEEIEKGLVKIKFLPHLGAKEQNSLFL